MPKVSVILTSFNHDKYIREAIDSVLNQTFTDYELIIWDDASSDNSWEIICRYDDIRIKAYRNENNMRGGNINRALMLVSGEYIAIHHSDDVWETVKLDKQVAFLDAHQEFGAVFTNALAIDEEGAPLSDETHFYQNIFEQPNRTRHEWLRHFFTIGNALCHPSVLIRKTCYEDCGLYRFGLAQLGDFDMWIRLCLKHEIHVLPERLTRFRVRNYEANASGNRPETRIRGQYEFYKILQNYRKLTSFDDLIKVFPSAGKYYRIEDADLNFVLAMISLEEKPYTLTELFGLDLLFEAISDQQRAERIKLLYNFDYTDFIVLTGKHDVFMREEVTVLWRSQAERDQQLEQCTKWLNERAEDIKTLNQQLAEREQHLERYKSWLTERDQQIEQCTTWLTERTEDINTLNQQLAERDLNIEQCKTWLAGRAEDIKILNQQLAERDQHIKALTDSYSWRITTPLRWLANKKMSKS